MSQSLLLICRRAPCSGLAAREMLDIALAGGAFELPISLLFLDDGVLQLAAGDSERIQQKSLSANLQALPLFGIEQLYACRNSLAERGLQQDDSVLPVEWLQFDEIQALIARHDQVITL